MGPAFLRKYNTAITAGTAQSIKIPMVKRGVVDFAVGADWTPAAGDVKVSKDGGAAASIATLPAAVAMGNTAYWEFVFSGAELSCGTLAVTIADSATKAVEDQAFLIETFGNASALYQADLSLANLPSNVAQWNGTNVASPATAGIPDVNAKNVNNVATTSITAINANLGTTQPVNFTGTGASALAKSDMVDIAGAAVSTSTAQIGVNAVNWAGGAIPATNVTGVPLIDAKYLLGTIFVTPATSGIMDINLKNIANSAVSTSTAQLGVNAVNWGGGAIPAVNVTGVPLVDLKYTLGTISPATAGSVRADSVTGAVGSVTGAVGSVTGAVGSVTGAVGSVTGNVGGNVVGSVASVTAAVAVTSNVKKNQALSRFAFLMTDSTNHSPASGKTVTVTRSIDGAAFGAGTLANVTEVANGIYTVDFLAADLNGNVIEIRATATGCDDTFERIVTQP